jgi:integrase/recombinase XerD
MLMYQPTDLSITAYAAYLKKRLNRSPRTIEEYARDVEFFGRFLEPTHAGGAPFPALLTATPERVGQFIEELSDKGYSAVAVRRKIAALRGFFRFHKRAGNCAENPCDDLELPSIPERLPKALSEDEVGKLLHVRPKRRFKWLERRDAAILEIFYATGIRRAELVGIDVADVDIERKAISVIGKGNKQRFVILNDPAIDALQKYLKVRPKTEDPALFLSTHKGRIGHRQAWVIFNNAVKASGIRHATPHAMRHSFGTHMLLHGADIMAIKELLGHKSVATTQIYARVTLEHARSHYNASHPRAKIA